jgi:hypothetical protein
MKKIERIRAREAARVCLVESRRLIDIAKEKMLSVDPGSLRIRDDFAAIIEHHDRALFVVVDDQRDET